VEGKKQSFKIKKLATTTATTTQHLLAPVTTATAVPLRSLKARTRTKNSGNQNGDDNWCVFLMTGEKKKIYFLDL
jgi:hypothetical protein